MSDPAMDPRGRTVRVYFLTDAAIERDGMPFGSSINLTPNFDDYDVVLDTDQVPNLVAPDMRGQAVQTDTEIAEHYWATCQNIDVCWDLVNPCRSMMVGDVVEINGIPWVAVNVGFKAASWR